jgi:hypothetical protein
LPLLLMLLCVSQPLAARSVHVWIFGHNHLAPAMCSNALKVLNQETGSGIVTPEDEAGPRQIELLLLAQISTPCLVIPGVGVCMVVAGGLVDGHFFFSPSRPPFFYPSQRCREVEWGAGREL